MLDGDQAGRGAALRILPLVFKANLEFRFLLLPEKADPDDLLRQSGPSALEPLRAKSCSAIELIVSENLPQGRPASTQEKTVALRAVFELLKNVSSEVAREDYIQTASKLINIDATAALRDFNKQKTQAMRGQAPKPSDSEEKTPNDPLLTQATWELLWLVLHYPEYGVKISQIIDYDWINISSTAGKLLGRILAEYKEGLIEDTSHIENLIESVEERQLLAEIHTRDLAIEDPKVEIQRCLIVLYRKHLNDRKAHLENKIANRDTEPELQLRLMREVSLLRKQLATSQQLEI